jgi:hypothetical protein
MIPVNGGNQSLIFPILPSSTPVFRPTGRQSRGSLSLRPDFQV